MELPGQKIEGRGKRGEVWKLEVGVVVEVSAEGWMIGLWDGTTEGKGMATGAVDQRGGSGIGVKKRGRDIVGTLPWNRTACAHLQDSGMGNIVKCVEKYHRQSGP